MHEQQPDEVSSFEVYDSRPWLKSYASHSANDLGKPEYANFGDMIHKASRQHAGRPAFTICLPNGTAATMTFAEVDRLSDQFAAYLRFELQLATGDRVAIQSPNCLVYPVFLFGAAKAGCVIVNINPLYTAPEIEHTLRDSGARLLVMSDMFADKLSAVLPASNIEKVLLTSVADCFPWLPRFIVKTVQKLKRMVPACPVPTQPFTVALGLGAKQIAAGQKIDPSEMGLDDSLALQYTGGTTGPSKGAVLTHGNLISNAAQVCNHLEHHLPENRTALTALPLYHIFAMGVASIFYRLGGHNVLIPSPRPVNNLKAAFAKYDVTFFSGVNTLFNGLLNEQWFQDSPPRNLAITIGGGMAVQDAVAERWQQIVGRPLLQAYGLTETSPGISINPMERPKLGSIGIPNADTWCRIVDDQGQPVPLGKPGELVVKGPQVMKGYWNRPEATEEALRDGWFHTGDIAYMDEDGYFFIVDRKKDMVIVSGFNVYPNEVEGVLIRYPGVREVGVVGVPDKETGEAVRAYVVLSDQSVTEDALREHCRQFLTGYKVPKQIVFRQELPLSPVGKVLRKDLRAEALRETSQV